MTPIARKGENGALNGRSSSDRACLLNASRNRMLMIAIDSQVTRARIPVTLISHVNACPLPQTAVKNEKNEIASVILIRRHQINVSFFFSTSGEVKVTHKRAGTGTPLGVTHEKTFGASPWRASASNMRLEA